MLSLQQIRRLSTLVLNKPQLFHKGIQRVFLKTDLLPFTWYLGKTLVTTNVYFKNDKGKSKSLVTKNDTKITKKKKKVPKGEEMEECPQCNERFQNSCELEEHIKEFHVVKCQKCPHCDTICTTKYGLNLHLAVCKGTREEYKCPECKETFITKIGFENHLKNVHSYDRVYICDFFYGCGRAFKTDLDLSIFMSDCSDKSKSLVKQNKVNQNKKVKNETKTTKKEKKITKVKELEEEDEIVIIANPKTKRYRCTYEGCSKSYTTKGNLDKHIKEKHLEIKPYKCDSCDKSFAQKSHLKQHISDVHLKLKPFECDVCGECFAQKSHLKQHISDVHLKLKPFECDMCGECFAQQNHLDNHKSSQHADLKLVECPDCGEKFKHSKQLETHIKKFHVVTDHQCPHCKMYCTTKRGLNQHIDKCLDNRKFKCTKCGEAFTRQDTLDAHIEHKHSRMFMFNVSIKSILSSKCFSTFCTLKLSVIQTFINVLIQTTFGGTIHFTMRTLMICHYVELLDMSFKLFRMFELFTTIWTLH